MATSSSSASSFTRAPKKCLRPKAIVSIAPLGSYVTVSKGNLNYSDTSMSSVFDWLVAESIFGTGILITSVNRFARWKWSEDTPDVYLGTSEPLRHAQQKTRLVGKINDTCRVSKARQAFKRTQMVSLLVNLKIFTYCISCYVIIYVLVVILTSKTILNRPSSFIG